MNETKFRPSIFSKRYFIDMLRSLKGMTIVMAIIAVLYGYLHSFSVLDYFLRSSIFFDDAFILIPIIFFVAAAFKYHKRMMSGPCVNLYGFTPFAKRTIWGSSFAAVLVMGLAVIVAYLIGFAISMLISAGGAAMPIYDRLFSSLILTLAGGILAYAFITAVAGITGLYRTLFLIIGLGYLVPRLWAVGATAASDASGNGLSIFDLLFPVSADSKQVLGWVFLALIVLVMLFLSYLSSIKAKAETSGNHFSNRFWHVASGILLSFAITMLFFVEGLVIIGLDGLAAGESDSPGMVIGTIVCSILVYSLYMLATSRSLRKTLKSLIFYPCVIVLIATMPLASTVLRNIDRGVDLSQENIEYVTIEGHTSELFITNGHADFVSSVVWENLYYTRTGSGWGMDGEDDVMIRDDAVVRLIAKGIKGYRDSRNGIYSYDTEYSSDGKKWESIIFDSGVVHVTLKDGKTYPVNLILSESEFRELWALLVDNGYVEKAVDLDRFNNPRLALPLKIDKAMGKEFANAFIEELKTLSLEELMYVYGYSEAPSDVAVYGNALITSPMSRYGQSFKVTSLTPNAAKLYMEACNVAVNRNGKIMQFADHMATNHYDYFSVEMLIYTPDSKPERFGASIDKNHEYISAQQILEYNAFLSGLIKGAAPVQNATYIMQISYYEMVLYEGYDGEPDAYFGDSIPFFIGITEEQYNMLMEIQTGETEWKYEAVITMGE